MHYIIINHHHIVLIQISFIFDQTQVQNVIMINTNPDLEFINIILCCCFEKYVDRYDNLMFIIMVLLCTSL